MAAAMRQQRQASAELGARAAVAQQQLTDLKQHTAEQQLEKHRREAALAALVAELQTAEQRGIQVSG